ncbi:MAG: polysaccharide biosynthesis tyrosine autokinase [Tannerellaceae bacterium]|jgi:capsular exopolysaccharide synthesis family protein|nr:polysaccharide biosynthesis tyrosine autokinase [Tannerellaceae bacterium]
MEQNTFTTPPREEENEISLSDILHIVKNNWLWFVLSVVACCTLATLYILWAPKVYTRTAAVLIKDDSKGGAMSESAAFEDLGMFNVKRNVDNEVLVFQSEQLMSVVARRLSLDISYTVREGLRSKELYTHSPMVIQFFDVEEPQEFTLKATPLSDSQVLLSGFPESSSKDVIVTLNDTIETSLGNLLVTPTLYYMDEYYDVPITVTKTDMAEVIMYYREELQVALASKTATIINLTLRDASVPRAEDVLNTLIAVYNEAAINDKNMITVNTSSFINDRLIIIEKELGNVDADIETYKRENRLTDIQSETGMYLRESSQYSQEELGLENQKTLAGYIYNYLTDPSRSSDLIPANTGISDVNIEAQISEYNNTLLKRDRLISNSSSRNPVVLDLNNSLTAMKQTIIRAVDNLVVGLDIKIRNVRERDRQNTLRISEVPTQQRHVLSIERQQKIKEELYLYLLNKREENALTQAITESNARIIDAATGDQDPIAPKTKIILVAAFFMGIAIPAGYFWLLSVLNTMVRNRKDIEDVITIPFLGDVPLRVSGNKKKDKKHIKQEIVVRDSGRDSTSEAFRIVRTNMDFMQVKTDSLKVVMFTSFNPGSGKTFVSVNLAVSIALTNKKVVLIDLDIRRHTLSTLLQKEEDVAGITHYLSGQITDFRTLINKKAIDDMDNLDIIYAGPIPPNPAELLLNKRFDYLIAELRKEYDYILLDNVPAGVVADAHIVNRVADMTIYVVRAGLMDKRQLPELERLYRQDKFKNMSVILNAVNYKQAGYGYYGYGYQYGYSYGYGYSNEKKK